MGWHVISHWDIYFRAYALQLAADGLAAGFLDLGLKPGDTIAAWIPEDDADLVRKMAKGGASGMRQYRFQSECSIYCGERLPPSVAPDITSLCTSSWGALLASIVKMWRH